LFKDRYSYRRIHNYIQMPAPPKSTPSTYLTVDWINDPTLSQLNGEDGSNYAPIDIYSKPKILVDNTTISASTCNELRVHQGRNEYYLTAKCKNSKGNYTWTDNKAKLYNLGHSGNVNNTGNNFYCGGDNDSDYKYRYLLSLKDNTLYCDGKKTSS